MADQEHLDRLKEGIDAWNSWRQVTPDIHPDLREANLSYTALNGVNLTGADLTEAAFVEADLTGATLVGANLIGAFLNKANLTRANLIEALLTRAFLNRAFLNRANLTRADLTGTDLTGATISRANLSEAELNNATLDEADLSYATLSYATLVEADLSNANLSNADLTGTTLVGATLVGANLSNANLSKADLTRANLSGASLTSATIVDTDLTEAILTDCSIFGISAWNVQLEGATQLNLLITPEGEPAITIDNLKIAQFIYLLLNNAEIREVIDTIAKKAVLILGRFMPERKVVLNALKEALRTQGYLPILFDFEKPSSRNITETVRTLAHLSRFIIADLTDPSSIPQELYAIVPTLAVPVRPVLLEGKKEYAMSIDLLNTYHWMLPIHLYKDQADLLATLKEEVIEPAEQKAQELEKR